MDDAAMDSSFFYWKITIFKTKNSQTWYSQGKYQIDSLYKSEMKKFIAYLPTKAYTQQVQEPTFTASWLYFQKKRSLKSMKMKDLKLLINFLLFNGKKNSNQRWFGLKSPVKRL